MFLNDWPLRRFGPYPNHGKSFQTMKITKDGWGELGENEGILDEVALNPKLCSFRRKEKNYCRRECKHFDTCARNPYTMDERMVKRVKMENGQKVVVEEIPDYYRVAVHTKKGLWWYDL